MLLGGDFERGVHERWKVIIDIRTAAPRHHATENKVDAHAQPPSSSTGDSDASGAPKPKEDEKGNVPQGERKSSQVQRRSMQLQSV